MTQTEDPLLKWLNGISCSNTIFPNVHSQLITIDKTKNIEEALSKMIEFHILAVPIVEENTNESFGIISIIDILALILDHFTVEEFSELTQKEDSIWQPFYDKLLGKASRIAHQKMSTLLSSPIEDIHAWDVAFPVASETTLLEAIKVMVQTRSHRVIVIDGVSGKLINLITQMRILELLGTAIPIMQEARKPIRELEISSKCLQTVLSVASDEVVIKAFKKMKDHKVSSIAVVENGILVGNISVNDIKLMEHDLKYLNFLGLSVSEYLKLVNDPHSLHQERHPIRLEVLRKMDIVKGPVVRCTLDSSFGFLIKTMLYYQTHRIYIVNDSNQPIGVISLHDILSQILQPRIAPESK